MSTKTFAAPSDDRFERLDLRIAWLCGVTLFLEGYDIAAVAGATARFGVPCRIEHVPGLGENKHSQPNASDSQDEHLPPSMPDYCCTPTPPHSTVTTRSQFM